MNPTFFVLAMLCTNPYFSIEWFYESTYIILSSYFEIPNKLPMIFELAFIYSAMQCKCTSDAFKLFGYFSVIKIFKDLYMKAYIYENIYI